MKLFLRQSLKCAMARKTSPLMALACLALALACPPGSTAEAGQGPSHGASHGQHGSAIAVTAAWARPNLPNRPVAAYMEIAGAKADDRLIGAESPAFETVEIHTVEQVGDVMKMRPVEGIDLPAGGTASLAPGGHHLMLFGASARYAEGDSFPLTLVFEASGTVEVTVEVLKRGPGGHGHGEGHGHSHGGTTD